MMATKAAPERPLRDAVAHLPYATFRLLPTVLLLSTGYLFSTTSFRQALQEAVAQQDLLFGFAFAACGLLLAALFASLRKAVRRTESRVEELEQEMRLLRAGMTKVFVGAESSAGT